MEGVSVHSFSTICVFCGASPGKDPEFLKAAQNLGRLLAAKKIQLIYGGGCHGLMGAVSIAARIGRNKVLGIIPRTLRKIVGKTTGDEWQVSTMHERISHMLENSDAFIALPGGFGTLEEVFQIVSWAQLNIHNKPIGLLNVNHFFDGLLFFLDQAVEQHFISKSARRILVSAPTADELLNKLQTYVHEPDPIMDQLDWSEGSSKKRRFDLTLRL